jgi:hypothetical protein
VSRDLVLLVLSFRTHLSRQRRRTVSLRESNDFRSLSALGSVVGEMTFALTTHITSYNSSPAFFWPGPASTQLNPSPGPRQLNSAQLHSMPRQRPAQRVAQISSSAAQLNSASQASARASRCRRHLQLKMRLAVSFYYLVTIMCRFKVLCLLSPQTWVGVRT